MTAAAQFLEDRFGDAGLGEDKTYAVRRPSGRCGTPAMFEARRLSRSLQVHLEIDQVDKHLDMSLRLHIAYLAQQVLNGPSIVK